MWAKRETTLGYPEGDIEVSFFIKGARTRAILEKKMLDHLVIAGV